MIGVKGIFAVERASKGTKGKLSVAEEQVEVFTSPVYRGEEENSSLLYDSDLVLKKDTVDILINGHAYTRNEPQTELVAGCTVGDWSKTLKITGDRYWGSVLGFLYRTAPQEFTKMPLTLERAYGGRSQYTQKVKNGEPTPLFDLRKPVGTGFRKKRSELVGKQMPNIEYLKHKTTPRKPRKNRVATFGAIPSHWSPRIEFAGTYDENADPMASLARPADFDSRLQQRSPGSAGETPRSRHPSIYPIVSSKMKEILELFDYFGGIQFVKTLISLEDRIFSDYYALHVFNFIACVDEENSVVDRYEEDNKIARIDKLILLEESLKSRSLKERLIFRAVEDIGLYLFHESIVEAVTKVNPTGVSFFHVDEWHSYIDV